MKKHITILTLGILMLGSCSEDFLEKEPSTQKTVETFYNTPQDAFEGLVAAYDILQQGDYGHFLMMSEIASDNCFGGAGKTDGFGHNYWDWFRTENNQNGNAWRKYFQGIYRSNTVLANLDKVEWGNQSELRTQYEAEARFLRAFFYFDVVRLFGNVPLITKPLEAGEYEQPQAPAEEVYKQIAEDLTFAIENLPATAFGSINPGDYGRATKWAAEAMMGRVFLFYTGYYQKADIAGIATRDQVRGYIDDVITNSGHALVPEYRRLFRAASWDTKDYVGEDNIETVFAIKYTLQGVNQWGLNSGNRWQKFLGLRNHNAYPYGGGWGFCTVNPKLWNAFADGDTRKTASIIDVVTEAPSFTPVDQRQYTGYAPKKYAPTTDKVMVDGSEVVISTVENMGGNDQINQFDDWVIIRYSDVLLMAAELRLDGGGDAQTPFNEVRNRAFNGTAPAVAVSKAAIMEERRFEFALEGLRYWDLLRQGIDVANQAIDNTDPVEEFVVDFRPETGGFFKIPESQVNLSNGSLNQNAGWE